MKLNFMKYKYLYFFISALFLLPSIFSLIFWGLKPAIDFTGGSIIELKAKSINLKAERNKISEIIKKEGSELTSIQESGEKTPISRGFFLASDQGLHPRGMMKPSTSDQEVFRHRRTVHSCRPPTGSP